MLNQSHVDDVDLTGEAHSRGQLAVVSLLPLDVLSSQRRLETVNLC